jgi:hypothetical protein
MKSIFKKRLWLITGVLMVANCVWFFDYQYFLQDKTYGRLYALPDMAYQRSAHTATVLRDNKIFICGGIFTAEGIEVNNRSTEIFDPNTGSFSKGPMMTTRRAGHTATLLNTNEVLITGGFDSTGFLNSAILYDPQRQKITAISSRMSDKRAAHTATLLDDGRVLIVGGVSGGASSVQTAEFFDPVTREFYFAGQMHKPRTGHTATRLMNGSVLVVGGSLEWRDRVTSSCEIFDPQKNRFVLTDSMTIPRNKHAAILLADGNVLIAGGSSTAETIGGRYRSATIFETTSGKFMRLTNQMAKSRFKISNAGDLLPDGKAVIAGDGKYPEIYDPADETFHTISGSLGQELMYPTVTAMNDGCVLICGGYDDSMKSTSRAWLIKPQQRKDYYSFSDAGKIFMQFFRDVGQLGKQRRML